MTVYFPLLRLFHLVYCNLCWSKKAHWLNFFEKRYRFSCTPFPLLLTMHALLRVNFWIIWTILTVLSLVSVVWTAPRPMNGTIVDLTTPSLSHRSPPHQFSSEPQQLPAGYSYYVPKIEVIFPHPKTDTGLSSAAVDVIREILKRGASTFDVETFTIEGKRKATMPSIRYLGDPAYHAPWSVGMALEAELVGPHLCKERCIVKAAHCHDQPEYYAVTVTNSRGRSVFSLDKMRVVKKEVDQYSRLRDRFNRLPNYYH
ncbi:hypothetical protein J3R30DRAFT_619002 [Lentinula aciculospora]|uniref:Uncharacterized protein n=1 Tax=Lentinula aciculospora TaxID=153920 RepID=A0A9W9DL63_9AGAR|nr:hypothetical protein J3R30DRAFT_619002 [Lentinula aciculospora]